MNTNTVELNMNEMELVNGGGLLDSLSRIQTTIYYTAAQNHKIADEPIGGTVVLFYGIYMGIRNEITR